MVRRLRPDERGPVGTPVSGAPATAHAGVRVRRGRPRPGLWARCL